MAAKRTNKSKYTSPSTGEHCTCAQYIAEIVCTRVAEKDNSGKQVYKFWNTEKWKKLYRWQIILANRLIKANREDAVVKAINSPECRKMYSLRYPKLPEIIEKYSRIIKHQEENMKTLEVTEGSETRKVSFGKKTKINKLRDLDG